ncbi:transglycosylase domain-containing protein [Phocicoccus pinnipedialis]|uniref:Penicillin-binding protein 1F n=1 Tax=Phocicoccus pinnipedialis TaxID=110845 RepID=A0A6V7RC28_9BACL|nr:transglycosylase domain-containing protein [Jeotgalicoccus pinnipedialis]MBP1939532.1 penicillin-binding protein [Jeotgalicoccus pinnipedialis]CAD2075007.1 Penicillin-binding protein 1F [Jeotgalicoccus pinnipedialis]
MKKKKSIVHSLKKLFTYDENKKNKIHGNTFKERFKTIGRRFKETDHPFRFIFNTTYDTIWNVFLFTFLAFSLVGILFFSIGLGYFAALVNDDVNYTSEEINTQLTQITESTNVTFASGENLGTLKSDLIRESISYEDMPENVVKALIATEDENFYEHNGVVPKAFLRASLQELTASESGTGGSTLTQQLVKNQLLTNDPTFSRKASELLLAFKVEKLLSKEQILESYLNAVSFGRNANGQNIAGIQSAAKGIFGKDAKDLNIAESAFIAGLPQNPYAYTPFTQSGEVKSEEELQYGKNRQLYVLDRMLLEGVINKEEYNEAVDYDLFGKLTKEVSVPNQKYPFLTDEIERRSVQVLKYILAEKDDVSKEDVDLTPLLNQKYTQQANDALRNNGYQIETTINKDIYDTMQDVKNVNFSYYGDRSIYDSVDSTGDEKNQTFQHEVGAVLKDNDSGAILGFIGGRDYNKSEVNHATQTSRMSGSTMKPLAVYGPGIDRGLIVPDTVILDKKFSIYNPVSGTSYSPENYDKKDFGLISVKHALTNSYNLSTLRLWSEVRLNNPKAYLDKMEIPLTNSLFDENGIGIPSLPLGVNNLTVEENVNAFSSFANDGTMSDSYMIAKITDPKGNVIYEHENEKKRVWKNSTAYLMTDMLQETFRTGSAYHIRDYYKQIEDAYPWATKTGTSEQFIDSWMVAYNPKVTLGIWMGYDRNIPQVYSTDDDDHLTIYNWRNLADALQNTNPELMGYGTDYKKPASVKTEEFCGMLMSLKDDCKDTEDKVISGLVADDTKFSKKSGLNDQSVLDRNGANFDNKLSESDLQGTVKRSYDENYRIGKTVRVNIPKPKTSSSSKDKDD